MHRLVVATNNSHKLDELRAMLAKLLPDMPLELCCGADFPEIAAPEETGAAFEENALIKAQAYANSTGLMALADDSGLVVDALDGRPGVQSARYDATAELRNAKLLRELHGVPEAQRTARFVCVVALVKPGSPPILRRGTVEGRITQAPRGDAGFGYDPVFELLEAPHAGQTTAELTPAEKNAISHRARALAAIIPDLRWLAVGK